jgi:hypothetical protein
MEGPGKLLREISGLRFEVARLMGYGAPIPVPSKRCAVDSWCDINVNTNAVRGLEP